MAFRQDSSSSNYNPNRIFRSKKSTYKKSKQSNSTEQKDFSSTRGHKTFKDKDDNVANALNYMVSLLTRREYSQQELRDKCALRYSEEAIENALLQCIERGYQSDERFAEMLTRHAEFALEGPLKLKQRAVLKGVDFDLVEEHCVEINWNKLAYLSLCKKYTAGQEIPYTEQKSAIAYLARRGFLLDSCLKAVNCFNKLAKEELDPYTDFETLETL